LKNEAELLIEKLMNFYNVLTISELAEKLNTSQPAISQWKKKNYVKAIASKSRELGIYNQIFGDTNVSITQGNGGRAAGRDYQEGAAASNSQPELDDLTMSLIKKLIDKIGEEELQFKLMELIKNAQ
jgi:hypothetical protein